MRPVVVLPQRITRRDIEDDDQEQHCSIGPMEMEGELSESIEWIGNQSGYQHVGIVLVVLVVNLDEQPKCFNIFTQAVKIDVWHFQTSRRMKRI